jgi:hypothetical protein
VSTDPVDPARPPTDDRLLPYATPEPLRPRPHALVAVAVGLVAALVAGAFAVTSLGGRDGSASPEEAVERLFAALADEDLVGVLESLPPGERSAILPGVRDLAEELQRLRLLSDDLDLGGISGIGFEVEGLETESSPLAEGIAAVRLTAGTLTTSTDPADLPVGENLESLLALGDVDLDGTDADTSTDDLSEGDLRLVAVEEGDGWHVSLFYSLAEMARIDADLPPPDFGRGVQPVGAPSPEAVVEKLAKAAVTLDPGLALALLAPDEMRALHDYAPLFLDDLEADREEWLEEADLDLTVERLELDARTVGDVSRVVIRSLAVTGTVEGDPVSIDFDGDCMRFSVDGDAEEMCLSDATDAAPRSPHADDLGFTVVRHGGQWYLSPVRTGFDAALAGLRLLEPADFEGADSTFGQFVEAFAMGAFGFGGRGFAGAEGLTFDDDLAPEHDACFDAYDELDPDAGDEEWEVADRRVARCVARGGG